VSQRRGPRSLFAHRSTSVGESGGCPSQMSTLGPCDQYPNPAESSDNPALLSYRSTHLSEVRAAGRFRQARRDATPAPRRGSRGGRRRLVRRSVHRRGAADGEGHQWRDVCTSRRRHGESSSDSADDTSRCKSLGAFAPVRGAASSTPSSTTRAMAAECTSAMEGQPRSAVVVARCQREAPPPYWAAQSFRDRSRATTVSC
jgi:hypothetical protein